MAHSLLRAFSSNGTRGVAQDWSLEDIKGAAGAVFIAGADTVGHSSFYPRRNSTDSDADLGNLCGFRPHDGTPPGHPNRGSGLSGRCGWRGATSELWR